MLLPFRIGRRPVFQGFTGRRARPRSAI